MPNVPGPLLVPTWQLTDAIAANHDVYDLLIPNWGRPVWTNQYPDPSVTTLTPAGVTVRGLPASLAGISIGPRSTVDRVFTSWSTGKQFNPSGDGSAAPPLVRSVSLGAPLTFSQPADTRVGMTDGTLYSDAMTYGALIIAADPGAQSQQIGGTLLPASIINPNAVVNFGGNGIDGTQSPVITWPLLHLQLYLRAPIVSPPAKRLPQHFNFLPAATTYLAGAEVPIAMIPTFGRRSLRAVLRTNVALTSLRVGTVGSISSDTNFALETTVFSAGVTAASVNVNIQIEPLLTDYVMIYATPTAGATAAPAYGYGFAAD
jgi:hypothetical protein